MNLALIVNKSCLLFNYKFISVLKYVKQFMILLILCFCVHSSLSAQEIRQIDKKYQYMDKIYKYEDMGDVFYPNAGAYNYYVSANRKIRTGKTWGIVSLASFGIGGILLATVSSDNGFDDLGEGLFGAILIGYVGLPAGIIALVKIGAGKRDRRFSVDLFNQEYGFQLPKANPIELSLVLNNGLGLQLKF